MRRKKEKKEKKNNNSPKDKDNDDKDIPHEIGTYDDFVIYDKDKSLNDKLEFHKLESSPTLKDWLIIQREPQKTKSRFSEFFEEINQDKKQSKIEDKKDEDESENKNKINEIEDEKKDVLEDQKKDDQMKMNYAENLNKSKNLLYSSQNCFNNKIEENNLDLRNSFSPNVGSHNITMSINSSISNQGNSTNDTGFAGITNSLSNFNISNNSFNSKIIVVEPKEENFEPNVDIDKILSLKDNRTTIMIKNIPNKFTRDLLLSTIDQNFKGSYDLFIMPTDGNKNKNFGYSFINFTSSYFIPFFYYMFNKKKWSNTNSQKICEITYSKVQGRENLISHYPNKIIHFNNAKNITAEQNYIIPNEYKMSFNKMYPKHKIEEYKFYFVTKIPSN